MDAATGEVGADEDGIEETGKLPSPQRTQHRAEELARSARDEGRKLQVAIAEYFYFSLNYLGELPFLHGCEYRTDLRFFTFVECI